MKSVITDIKFFKFKHIFTDDYPIFLMVSENNNTSHIKENSYCKIINYKKLAHLASNMFIDEIRGIKTLSTNKRKEK